jgi:hypothetical protein
MIEAINLQNLRNAEFIQFSKDFTSLVNTNDPKALSVQPQYDNMVVKITELESLFMNATSNPITAEMEAVDIQRDQALNGIVAMVDAYSYHHDTVLAEAAVVLQNNLKLYDSGIAKQNYQSETAIINNLLADWETKPALSSAISTLQLSDWAKVLKSHNQDFNQKYLARTQDFATISPENQKSKRAEVMTAYYELRKFLEAFSTIQSSAAYEKTINELNALIEQYNFLLKGRATSKPAEKNKASLN